MFIDARVMPAKMARPTPLWLNGRRPPKRLSRIADRRLRAMPAKRAAQTCAPFVRLVSNKPAQVSALPVIAARSNFPSLNRPSSKGPVAVTILTPVYWLHRRGVPYADLGADHFERSDAPGSPEDSPNSASMSPLATKRCDEGLRTKALRASGSVSKPGTLLFAHRCEQPAIWPQATERPVMRMRRSGQI